MMICDFVATGMIRGLYVCECGLVGSAVFRWPQTRDTNASLRGSQKSTVNWS